MIAILKHPSFLTVMWRIESEEGHSHRWSKYKINTIGLDGVDEPNAVKEWTDEAFEQE